MSHSNTSFVERTKDRGLIVKWAPQSMDLESVLAMKRDVFDGSEGASWIIVTLPVLASQLTPLQLLRTPVGSSLMPAIKKYHLGRGNRESLLSVSYQFYSMDNSDQIFRPHMSSIGHNDYFGGKMIPSTSKSEFKMHIAIDFVEMHSEIQI